MKEKIKTSTDEDSELVSLCKKDDMESFEALVKKYQKKMFNIAYRMLGSYEDAGEIVQDAFVSTYRNINNFKGKSRFSTWLYTIVVNLSRNRLKQIKMQGYREEFSIDTLAANSDKHMKIDPVSTDSSVLENMEKREVQKRVQECINRLDHEFREAVILRDINGFSYDEISDMLKIPEGTVKSRISRARLSLKDCLKKVLGNL
jgi:RNA polymerase sigma-70 factor (ECF subfamily)